MKDLSFLLQETIPVLLKYEAGILDSFSARNIVENLLEKYKQELSYFVNNPSLDWPTALRALVMRIGRTDLSFSLIDQLINQQISTAELALNHLEKKDYNKKLVQDLKSALRNVKVLK